MAHGSDYQKQKFFFLKLPKDWLKNARVKKLRSIAGGDTYTIIYLKLLLMSIGHDCKILYEGLEPTLAEELALKIDEKKENIEATLAYFKQYGMLTELPNGDLVCEEALRMVGSTTYDAIYRREKREEIKLLGSEQAVGQIPTNIRPPSDYKNIEEEKELDKELDLNKEIDIEINKESSKKPNAFAIALTNKLTDIYVKKDTKEWNEVAEMITNLLDLKMDPLKLSNKINEFQEELEYLNLNEIKNKSDYLKKFLKGEMDDDLSF